MNITFLGAAREVTGSCYLVETTDTRFLVDCGMVQGGREAPARNRKPFAFDPKSIDFVLLTHAHIDHSGLLPKLTRAGFQGPIYTTAATADLLQVMLPDSAHIQEGDAERAKRHNKSAHDRSAAPTPLYTMQDARDCLRQVRPIAYDQELTPHPVVRCRFRDAGHILGSAIIEAWVTEHGQTTKLVFSGDLGQPGRPILRDPTPIEDADILLMESTYGDRTHKDLAATEDELIGIVERTLHEQGGNVIVPAFAVGRTQEILYHLHRLTREGRLRNLKVFVDSPMATEATRITRQHLELFDAQAKDLAGWHALGKDLPYLHFTASADESRALNQIRSGALIISASGMCDAGRIKHHLRHNLPRRECGVLITGFQAQGTLGRRLVDGAKRVRIFGEDIPVRAATHTVGGLSAHARYYEEARRFTHLVSSRFQQEERRDFVVVTGGGPGIMEAANRGAFEAGARSIGLNVTLPHEQEPNPFISPELAFRFRYFALRKMHFLLRARALVAFPGGYGTLDELFEVLTLVQTGKMARIPIVLVGREFWRRAVDFDYLVEEGFISAQDVRLFTCVDAAEEIVAVLEAFYGGKPPAPEEAQG